MIGKKTSKTDQLTTNHLKADIEKVSGFLTRQKIGLLLGAIVRPGKSTISIEYEMVSSDYDHIADRLATLNQSLDEAHKGEKIVGEEDIFFHDYILLPVQIYVDLLNFETELHLMAQDKKQFENTGDPQFLNKAIQRLDAARQALKVVYDRSLNGDKNPTWKGWYAPENRRPNNGFPTQEMIDSIEANLRSLK